MVATRATQNYIGVYQDITENYTGTDMYNKLAILDEVAGKCLTFAEYTEYHKTTTKIINELVEMV